MLKDAYGIDARTIRFLASGNDPFSSTFDVSGRDGQRFFLKLRSDGPTEAVSRTLRTLADAGLAPVVAPIVGSAGQPYARVCGHAAVLFPYIDGVPAITTGLSTVQWEALGRLLRSLHRTVLPDHARASLPIETFHPRWGRVIREIDRTIVREGSAARHDPLARRFARVWLSRRSQIRRLLTRIDQLGRLAERRAELALCHADIHLANVIVDPAGALHVVDWDGMILAPVERDLMFIPDELREPFARGYGTDARDPLLIVYYLHEWAVQEIGDYATRVSNSAIPNDARADALDAFANLFDPDGEVDSALSSDASPLQ